MLNYIPTIHEDELVYSWLSRIYTHSGFLSHKEALRYMLFSKSNNPSIEFIGHISSEFHSLISQVISMEELATEHTMFPQYGRFIPLRQKQRALHHLTKDYCDAHTLFCILPRGETERYLKYCPLCIEEDRSKYGEAYWHRTHQIRNITICPKHCCYLEFSNVFSNSEKVFTLSSAEEDAPITVPRMATDSTSINYAKYLAEIFLTPIGFKSDTPISSVFYYALQGSSYMPKSTKARNTKRLSEDMNAFYGKIGISNIASFYQIQRVLLGDRFDFLVVCQIAFFLAISSQMLTAPNLTNEQIKIEQSSHYMKGKATVDWGTLDFEIAPKLEKLAYATYYGTKGRPSRLSERKVYRELGLNAHALDNLPLCKSIMEKYAEPYESAYARRLIWAYHKLQSDRGNSPIYWTDLRVLSGVKSHNLQKIIPYLNKHTDKATAVSIYSLIP